MYNFIDVTEASEGFVLLSEALKINGEYIENQIPGYRTLNVKGREALSPDVVTYTAGIRDGSRLKNKRYPERIITVTYQIAAASNEEFRDAYNKLGKILDVQDAELIFNDEPDKYFVGTPCIIDEVTPGRNNVVGNFEILCADPFKYSVVEYEATPGLDASSVLIDYNGTYKSFPILEADFYNESEVADDGETAGTLTGAGDCGFVAFFTEDEKIVQLGDPDEADATGNYAKSQTLINQAFLVASAWGTAGKKPWAVNSGNVLGDSVQDGSVAVDVADYAAVASPKETTGTLLNNKRSDGGAPLFYFTVKAKTRNRTASSVVVDVAITTSLGAAGSYFGRGYGLTASLYIGGAWRNVTLKTTSEYWRGKSGHTTNLSVTVTGLASGTTALTGIKFKATRSDSLGGAAGNLSETACSNLAISPYTVETPDSYYLCAAGFGTHSGVWHGPAIKRTLPADAAGEVGAANFTLTYQQKMCIGNVSGSVNQLGAFQANLTDANGANIAGVRILKNKSGNSASLLLYINGVKVHETAIDLSYNNKYFGAGSSAVKTSTIKKSGDTITFNIGGYCKSFADEAIADKKAVSVTFMLEQFSAYTKLGFNGLYMVKFVKDNCASYKDVPNKFSANDVLEADCNSGEIYLNGVQSPGLGALGNDWEGFFLTPGLNQIGFAYSNWVDPAYAPKIKVRYREVFL